MNRKINSFLFLLLLCGLSVFAQDTLLLKGVVTSGQDGSPIPGVNVNVLGETGGTTTDFDGNYGISVPSNGVIQFSYVGFKTQVITIGSETTINVTMDVDNELLDEVVVIGYGTQSRSEVTAAVGRVRNDDLDQIAVSTAQDALVGQVAGLNIQATDSEAGADATVSVRGIGSIAGSSDPLLVVDGLALEFSFFNSIDVNDIKSVEVLKDAASAAIYGSRAAGGVIIITTKEGKEGKTKFSYSTFTGVKEAIGSDDYDVSVAEWNARELRETGELSPRAQYRELIGVDEPWQDRFFDGGIIESHFLSARGGSKRTKFSTSLSYLNDEGVLITDSFEKINFKLKADTKVNDNFKFGASLAPSYTNRRRFDGGIDNLIRQQPWLPTRHTDHTIQFVDRDNFPDVQVGDYAREDHFQNFDLFGDGSEIIDDISSTRNQNPIAQVVERDNRETNFRMYGKFYGDYKIAKGLSARLSIGGDYSIRRRKVFDGIESGNITTNPSQNIELELESRERIHILTEALINYNTSFGGHKLDVVAGASRETFNTAFEEVIGIGFENDLIQNLNAATSIPEFESFELEENLVSVFGRANWSYKNKYLGSVSLRTDGSSVFGENNKFGFFPAVSLAWNIGREDFFSEIDFVNDFKLRASYGFTGNNALNLDSPIVNTFPSIQLLGPATFIDNSGSVAAGLEALNIANPDLRWERSREVNGGLDFGFFNNAISGSIDVYNKTSDQLLLNVPVSSVTGFNEALLNRGEVVNRGIEVELRTRNVSNKNFRWTSTILASTNENELTDFAGASGLISFVETNRAAEFITLEGQPITSFFGFVVDREIPLEFINDPFRIIGGQAQDVYVKDLNGDGIIDDDDRTIIGDPFPDLVWSIANDFKYKNFDASFTFQGSWGAQIRNISDAIVFNHFSSSQDFIPETTPDQGFIREKIFTDDIIQDASFVSLRTVNIGYTFDSDLSSKIGITNARIYASGQNLVFLVGEDFSGFNPEGTRDNGPLNQGIQRRANPLARTVSLGLNVEF